MSANREFGTAEELRALTKKAVAPPKATIYNLRRDSMRLYFFARGYMSIRAEKGRMDAIVETYKAFEYHPDHRVTQEAAHALRSKGFDVKIRKRNPRAGFDCDTLFIEWWPDEPIVINGWTYTPPKKRAV